MHGLSNKDGDRRIDWGKTSKDYALSRPGPPSSFYRRLADLGVGLPGQHILDLGTGTGVLARQFGRQGARVAGVDIAQNQIRTARRLAEEDGLAIDFRATPAEQLPWQEPTFDFATANQCFLYFDKPVLVEELRRVLRPGGGLVTSHFSWMPRKSEIARQSEALVLAHNPDWSASDWDGVIPDVPDWSKRWFEVERSFVYDEPIPFTRQSWAGRIRACRGVGATMTAEEVARFDREHRALLERIAAPTFDIPHRIDAHVFRFKTS